MVVWDPGTSPSPGALQVLGPRSPQPGTGVTTQPGSEPESITGAESITGVDPRDPDAQRFPGKLAQHMAPVGCFPLSHHF